MCAAIGVDPLSSSKGFWAEVLGMGDFYYELSVRVVEYCMAYRDATGGLIALSTIAKDLKAEPADIETALGKLRSLGKGYQVIGKGSQAIVQAVPGNATWAGARYDFAHWLKPWRGKGQFGLTPRQRKRFNTGSLLYFLHNFLVQKITIHSN